MPAVLEALDLHKAYGGVKAVDGVSFAVGDGEIVAIIGPNGAGKSTCFNLLNGQIQPDMGQVRLAAQDITGRPAREIWRLGVGRTFQVTATFVSMTVRENVQVALWSRERRAGNLWRDGAMLAREEADALLAQVGIVEDAERSCGKLAYGDLKRVELAIALANAPRLLLMDEPTAGMAPRERMALMELTARLTRERGLAVLFTEHDMDVVFAYAGRVLVMDRGRLIAEGTPEEVRANADVRAVYLGTRAERGEARRA
jgi:branched-chain amino acid transport system ATP-binding protein